MSFSINELNRGSGPLSIDDALSHDASALMVVTWRNALKSFLRYCHRCGHYNDVPRCHTGDDHLLAEGRIVPSALST